MCLISLCHPYIFSLDIHAMSIMRMLEGRSREKAVNSTAAISLFLFLPHLQHSSGKNEFKALRTWKEILIFSLTGTRSEPIYKINS